MMHIALILIALLVILLIVFFIKKRRDSFKQLVVDEFEPYTAQKIINKDCSLEEARQARDKDEEKELASKQKKESSIIEMYGEGGLLLLGKYGISEKDLSESNRLIEDYNSYVYMLEKGFNLEIIKKLISGDLNKHYANLVHEKKLRLHTATARFKEVISDEIIENVENNMWSKILLDMHVEQRISIEFASSVMKRKLVIGMPASIVKLIWFEPNRVSNKALKTKTKQTWTYYDRKSNRLKVSKKAFFDDGILVSWEEEQVGIEVDLFHIENVFDLKLNAKRVLRKSLSGYGRNLIIDELKQLDGDVVYEIRAEKIIPAGLSKNMHGKKELATYLSNNLREQYFLSKFDISFSEIDNKEIYWIVMGAETSLERRNGYMYNKIEEDTSSRFRSISDVLEQEIDLIGVNSIVCEIIDQTVFSRDATIFNCFMKEDRQELSLVMHIQKEISMSIEGLKEIATEIRDLISTRSDCSFVVEEPTSLFEHNSGFISMKWIFSMN